MDLLTQSIILNVLLLFVSILLVAIDKDSIKAKLKVKLGRGYSYALFVGLDRRIQIKAIKTSAKKNKLEEFDDGGYKYKLKADNLCFINKIPTWIYIEGKVDPLNPNDLLNIEGIDGEWLSKVIDKAFIAGKLPESNNNKKFEMIWMATLACSAISLFLVAKLAGFV